MPAIPEVPPYKPVGAGDVSGNKALQEKVENAFSEKPAILTPHSRDTLHKCCRESLPHTAERISTAVSILPHGSQGKEKEALEVIFHAVASAVDRVYSKSSSSIQSKIYTPQSETKEPGALSRDHQLTHDPNLKSQAEKKASLLFPKKQK